MRLEDILIIAVVFVAVVIVVLYYLNRRALSKMNEAQSVIDKNKTTVSIYVIDKKKDRPQNSNIPKAIISQLPKSYKWRKVPLVKAKIGPQITTLICDPKIFKAIPVKKNVKVDMAGLYIINMKGYKADKVTAKSSFWDKAKAAGKKKQ